MNLWCARKKSLQLLLLLLSMLSMSLRIELELPSDKEARTERKQDRRGEVARGFAGMCERPGDR
jgi:hypothetical protein